MAHNTARKLTVLYGGNDGARDGETWEWDGNAWTIKASPGPSWRYAHAMAYDSARDVTVLFGGAVYSGASRETWEWDGRAWSLRSSSGPDKLSYHSMAYDSLR